MTRFLLCLFLMLVCLIRLSCTDLQTKELENLFIFLLLPCAFFTTVPLLSRAAGVLLPFLLIRLYGFGDILLLSVLGSVFGAEKMLYLYVIAAFSCGIFSLAGLLLKKCGAKDTIPFAPFISAAALFVMFEYRSALFF